MTPIGKVSVSGLFAALWTLAAVFVYLKAKA